MIHTNRCVHCGKTKEEHISATGYSPLFCNKDSDSLKTFTDSGLAALDAHKEELWEAITKYFKAQDMAFLPEAENWGKKIRSILNQIEKEK